MFDKNKDKQKKGLNPIAVGVTGAIVGAGMAVAASKALQGEKNRKKIKEAFTNVKDQTLEYVQNFNSDPKIKNKAKDLKKAVTKTKRLLKKKTKKK